MLVERADLRLHRCGSCGFVSGEPLDRVPADARYAGYYDGKSSGDAPITRYSEWLADAEHRVGLGRLLEIGAGGGGFTRAALERGWKISATEISRSALARLEATDADVFAGDVLDANYAEGSFDFLVCLEVIEHVPEPSKYFREFARLTRPGGSLLLTTPNFDGLSRRILGPRWRVIDPEHLGYFTPRTLKHALLSAGYSKVTVRSRTLDVTSWRRQSRTESRPQFDPRAAAILRERVEGHSGLRALKDALNRLLAIAGLGDSLLAWGDR